MVLLSAIALLSLSVVVVAQEDVEIFVDASSGDDDADGSSASNAVRSVDRALELVANVPRPLRGHVHVNLSGMFLGESIRPRQRHYEGTSSKQRLVFRTNPDDEKQARLCHGVPLKFERASDLDEENANLDGLGLDPEVTDKLWIAAPHPSLTQELAAAASSFRWADADCRDGRAAPPVLTVGGRCMTRAREPNLPPPTTPAPPFGETRDAWLRTVDASTDSGRFAFDPDDRPSIDLASDADWDGGEVTAHAFPRYDWYDARLAVTGDRSEDSEHFYTNTRQRGPGSMTDDFVVEAGTRYYLEGSSAYLDAPGEYFVDLANDGRVLFYPPEGFDDPTSDVVDAVLSLYDKPVLLLDDEYIPGAFVMFENLQVEGGRTHLAVVDHNNCVEFNGCTFVNAGHDAAVVRGHHCYFKNNVFRGIGGSAMHLSDTRNLDEDGPDYALLESGNVVVNNVVEDYARTCRHYSEAVVLGGFGAIVANNHVMGGPAPAIGVAGRGAGGLRILHNVFTRTADGAYDTGVVHLRADSPMDRGTEIAYNVFARNGVSKEPCHRMTNCVVADVYLDGAGGLSVHGNVFLKDKVKQPAVEGDDVKDTSEDEDEGEMESMSEDEDEMEDEEENDAGYEEEDDAYEEEEEEDERRRAQETTKKMSHYSTIQWFAVYANGGADVKVYENVFVGPNAEGYSGAKRGALYMDRAALFVQTSANTLLVDEDACGHTGVCADDEYYGAMRDQQWSTGDWSRAFPELRRYRMPDPGSDWYCADEPSCPLAPWNNTVSCNAGSGTDPDEMPYEHRAVWPTDDYSDLSGAAEEGANVPDRSEALGEFGNRVLGATGAGVSEADVDSFWMTGSMDDLLALAKRVAAAAEAEPPHCRRGLRKFATRPDLAGPGNNACAGKWTKGVHVCDPCETANCAARDPPRADRCSCTDVDDHKRMHKEFVGGFLKRGKRRRRGGGGGDARAAPDAPPEATARIAPAPMAEAEDGDGTTNFLVKEGKTRRRRRKRGGISS